MKEQGLICAEGRRPVMFGAGTFRGTTEVVPFRE